MNTTANKITLLRVALIHNTAVAARMTSIRQSGNEIHIYPQKTDLDRWSEVADKCSGKLRMLMSGEPHLCLRVASKGVALDQLQECLDRYLATAPAGEERKDPNP